MIKTTLETLMPSLFIAHGSPMIVIEKNPYVDFLASLHKTFKKPEAIVIFSAHWEESVQTISTVDKYSTIYDFYGFPKEMYKLTYPAKGNPALSKEIHELFKENGIKSVFDEKRGLDHGAWTILKIMFPNLDIPVVSLSVNPNSSPEELYKIGSSLAPLREKGVLVIGSGVTVHNLGKVSFHDKNAADKWAVAFDDWLVKNIKEWNTSELFQYRKKAPHAKEAVPTPEHFIPLILAMGAGANTKQTSVINKHYEYGSLSYLCFRFD